jgi:hypothetical protein
MYTLNCLIYAFMTFQALPYPLFQQLDAQHCNTTEKTSKTDMSTSQPFDLSSTFFQLIYNHHVRISYVQDNALCQVFKHQCPALKSLFPYSSSNNYSSSCTCANDYILTRVDSICTHDSLLLLHLLPRLYARETSPRARIHVAFPRTSPSGNIVIG